MVRPVVVESLKVGSSAPDVPGVDTLCRCRLGSSIFVPAVKYGFAACHSGAFNPGVVLVSSRSAQETGLWSATFVQILKASGSGEPVSPVSPVVASGSVVPMATTKSDSSVGQETLGFVIVDPQVEGSAPGGMSLIP